MCLDQPLWGEGPRGRGLLTTNMMALCLQLDAAIVTSFLKDEVCLSFSQHFFQQFTTHFYDYLFPSIFLPQGGGREGRVTFQQKLPAKVASLLDQMTEQLTDYSNLDLEVMM